MSRRHRLNLESSLAYKLDRDMPASMNFPDTDLRPSTSGEAKLAMSKKYSLVQAFNVLHGSLGLDASHGESQKL